MRYREPLDRYDCRPPAMENYMRYHGLHFSEKLADWAVNHMFKEDEATGEEKKVEAWTREQIEKLLKKYNITLKNDLDSDVVYVANMLQADNYGSGKSLDTEERVAKSIKEHVDDIDQPDGFIFNRFYADCVLKGVPIPWERVL